MAGGTDALAKILEQLRGHPTLDAALALFEGDAVHDVRRAGAGWAGSVADNRSLFRVALERDWVGGSPPPGSCTCRRGPGCAHFIAVCLWVATRGVELTFEQQDNTVRWWLSRLASVARGPAGRAGEDTIVYRLHRSGNAFVVGVSEAKPLKRGGGFSTAGRPLDAYSQPPAWLTREEAELVRLLTARDAYGGVTLGPRTRAEILQRMIATGRCLWGRTTRVLSIGEARTCSFHWEVDEAGQALLRVRAGDTPVTLVPVEPPWYLDEAAGVLGPIANTVRSEVAALLTEPPPVPARLAGVVTAALQQLELPVPPPPGAQELVKVEPRARVEVRHHEGTRTDWSPGNYLAARMEIDYDGLRVPPAEGGLTLARTTGGRTEIIARDHARELAFRAELEHAGFQRDVGFRRAESSHPWRLWLFVPEVLMRFVGTTIPRWRAAGIEVEIEDLPFELIDASDDWYAEFTEGAGWFELELGIEVDGERVSLLEPLLAALRAGQVNLGALAQEQHGAVQLQLDAKRFVHIPAERLTPLANLLLELHADRLHDGRLRLDRHLAAMLDLPERVAVRTAGAASLRTLAEALRGHAELPPAPEPRGLKTELRPYQRTGLAWLQFLHAHGLGGLLADDMGLGKTVQTLAFLLAAKRGKRPSLVLAPRSVLGGWREQARVFAPSLKVLVHHGDDRAGAAAWAKHDLVVTTYATLRQDAEEFRRTRFFALVLDEAQAVKNPRTKSHEIVRGLQADFRLALTGTPIENHLDELWSHFDVVAPGLLGNHKGFGETFRKPIEKQRDAKRLELLRRRIAPFFLRRLKDQVERELPPKTEIIRTVTLEKGQRDLYETVRLTMSKRVRDALAERGVGRSAIVVLDALLKLRQVCCHPALLPADEARAVTESAKLELLLEMLPELVDEGRRVLLFSQFVSMLDLIAAELEKVGLPYQMLTGKTRDRQSLIDRFQAGEVPVFLISLKAGGTGLNLTAADTVIHYDPWWNPAVEDQATDRAHRIGQDKPVFVYKLVAEGTVEERIRQMQGDKAKLARDVLEGGASIGKLSPDEVRALFEPLG